MYRPTGDPTFLAVASRMIVRAFQGTVTPAAQAPVIALGEYITALNTAETGTVNLIGLATGDIVTLPTGVTINGDIVPIRVHISDNFDAATAVTRTGFIATTTYQVTGVSIAFGVASSSGTFAIEKLTGTTAPGSGTTMLTGTISTAGTANTVLNGTLTGTAGTLQLAVGDRIGFVFTGTETGLVGLNVTLALKRI